MWTWRVVVLIAFLAALGTTAHSEPSDPGTDEARWMRTPAVSPDGTLVAFQYKGDLWTVPIEGGEARPLTSHVAHDTNPVWSPDGERIAFASDRHGNDDVFTVPAAGGVATRLTHHSADDIPSDFTPDGTGVLFSSRRTDAPDAVLATTFLPELYVIDVDGGAPRRILTTPAVAARYDPKGTLIAYEDLKGYESPWRKHHTSSVTRDLWVHDPATGTHQQVTTWKGEDRNPCWSSGGLFFLSERSGSFEIWRTEAIKSEWSAPTAVTAMGPHPVRFLSAANNGALVFAYDGGLWVKRDGAEPARIPVRVTLDGHVNAEQRTTFKKGATAMAVAPKGKEIALIVRGDVFVASVEHGTTKRVTETTEQERSLTWAPDGRSLYYASERNGSWNLYRSTLVRTEEDALCRATRLEEMPVLVTEQETFQPICSPDGTQLAYVLDRDAIAVLDLASKTSRTLVPATRNYSYVDGDIRFTWSPDGRWLAFTMLETGRWIGAVGVVEVTTGEITNVTRSGYEEGDPRWSRNGTILTFASNRHGRKNHASWGSDSDVLGLYLTPEAFDRARLSEEEYEVLREKEKKAKKDRGGKEDDEDDVEGQVPEPVRIAFDGLEQRLRRLTIHSAPMGEHVLSRDGEIVLGVSKVGDAWGLWATNVRKGTTHRLRVLGDARPAEVALSRNGKTVFVLTGDGRIVTVDVGGLSDKDDGDDEGGGGRGRRGGGKQGDGESVSFAAEMTIDTAEQRADIFRHVWRQTLRKFYDPELHGVDWKAVGDHHEALLPHVGDGRGFAELLSEMLGELNASHTGARYRPRDREGDETAALGLLFEGDSNFVGRVVAEVLTNGPADRATSRIKPGTVLTHIDGTELTSAVNVSALLNRRAGRPVLLTLSDASGETWEEVIRPITLRQESGLLYERWVRQREKLTEQLSDGRIGYVHVRSMGDSSFRRVFKDALGKHGAREALVLDTRFNGGGWLHDDLVSFLGGTEYAWFVPRGKEKGVMGGEPSFRWARPVAVIQSEGNYSDAHFFPWAFKTLGLGPLIGTPVAGTATAVWWERLVDPDLVFGIPQVGMLDEEGRYLENQDLEPDVLVLTDPESAARGEDPQLAAAVRVLMKTLSD